MKRTWWTWMLLVALPAVPTAVLTAQEAGMPPEVSLEVSDDRPLLGQVVRLTATAGETPLAGARVAATYRPNSLTTSTEELGATDATGTVVWEPKSAGPVNLQVWESAASEEAPEVTVSVAVRYGGFPPSGLAIMLLAGALLFGGAAFGMTRLLRSPALVPGDEPPST